ncbi:MAG: replication initiation negative regulator SeqA [Colwellia sp.]|nr:replication initiation negative regulator SeqA [Colwellia sp.]MCW8864074.1 replication initiation negative regulator SeqA [Colwellia sp.]MCW9080583.1 replication initiation negative regulator SeqA [Colwellia sp.]
MKNIEIDEELYQYIVSNTQAIGESASSILRRLLALNSSPRTLSNDTTQAAASHTNKDAVSAMNTNADAEQADTAVMDNNVQSSQIASRESVFNFINKEELAMQRGAVGRFLLILAALYRANPDSFKVVTEICGRDRLYFAHSEAELAASGSSTKPKQIPDSPFWVMTNSNTTRKKMMLTKAAMSLGYEVCEVEKIRDLL